MGEFRRKSGNEKELKYKKYKIGREMNYGVANKKTSQQEGVNKIMTQKRI